MEQAHRNLFKFAVSKGLKVAVVCGEEGDVLQKSTNSIKKFVEAVNSVDFTNVVIRDTEKKETLGVASIMFDFPQTPDETINDYTVTPFMEEWATQYYKF